MFLKKWEDFGVGGAVVASSAVLPKECGFDPWLDQNFSSCLFCRERSRSKGGGKARRRRTVPHPGMKIWVVSRSRATPVHADRGTRCFLAKL